MSALCHQRKWPTSFDHLVGAAEQRRGGIDAERFSGANGLRGAIVIRRQRRVTAGRALRPLMGRPAPPLVPCPRLLGKLNL
jgi:hypothetical protein